MEKIKLDEDLKRTPFVLQQSGHWALFLISGKQLEWGIKFDPYQGYRFFIKFNDSRIGNVFSGKEAIKSATALGRMSTTKEETELSKIMKENATIVNKLNYAWKILGKPPHPIDQIESIHGHA